MTELKNLHNEAQSIRLSAQEKAVMRTQIFPTLRSGPRPQNVGVGAGSYFNFFSVRFMPAMAVVLIVLLGGGPADAARAALPGEVLDTIKVGVNEPVRQALGVSAEAKDNGHRWHKS